MRSNVVNIMRKEFARFFGDRRLMLMILLPAILIYVVYSVMGSAIKSEFTADDTHAAAVITINMPDEIARMPEAGSMEFTRAETVELERAKEKITLKEADLLVAFPPQFVDEMTRYDVRTGDPAPNVEVYFNSTEPNSAAAHSDMIALLDAFEAAVANKFDVNRDIYADAAAREDMTVTIISSLMPMLLMMFLYSGCVGLAPESIAGEKERGTLGTLLVSPLKRSELAVGKILSLGVLSFLSGLVTALATIMSLPRLMGGASVLLDTAIYGAADYALLVFVILSTILLLVTIVSILSALSRNVKEANTAVVPLMAVVMLIGASAMFADTQSSTAAYAIPLYGSVQCMNGIFSLDYSAVNVIVSCVSNLVFACIGSFALTKMFNSERIMFTK